MLIRSIEVRNYRTIRHAKVELGPGLNVIHGENDIGKSTVVDALLSAFAWRGRLSGTRLEAMRSHHGGQPEVEVAFEHEGAEYVVQKRFAANGSTVLTRRERGGVAREIADADDALDRILRLGERSKGRPSDFGMIPLLWVTQGAAGTAPQEIVSGAPSVVLSERLAEMSGAMVAGVGAEHVLPRVTAQYEQSFQSKAGGVRKGSPLSRAQQELEQAETELRTLRVRREQLDGTFGTRVAREREHRAVLARLPELVEEAKHAQTHWEEIQGLVARRNTAEADARARQLAANSVKEKVDQRQALMEQIADLGEQIRTENASVRGAEDRLRAHDVSRTALAEREGVAAEAERAAGATLDAARALADALAAEESLAGLARRVSAASSLQQTLVGLHERLGALRLGPADLSRLEKLERAAETAAAVLEAAAAGLEIVALQEGPIAVDGETCALRAGERMRRRVAAPMIVRVGNVAEIVVHPGGPDLATARESARAKRAALERALAAVSAASFADVRVAVEMRSGVETDIAIAQAQLEALAPAGLAALEQQCASERAKVEAAASALEGRAALGADEARDRANAATRGHQKARDAWEQARTALAAHDARRTEIHTALGVAQTRAAGTQRHLVEQQAALARSIAAEGTDQILAGRRGEAEATSAASANALAKLDAELAGQDQEVVKQRAAALGRARDQAHEERMRLEKEIHGLDARLDQEDAIDLDDRLDIAEAQVEHAQLAHARRLADAEAVRLLHEVLCACRDEARARFQGPLVRAVERLAGMLDPSAKVELDERYGVTLERASYGTHVFESLGGGCKEQLATVVRLAMADVLAGEGTLPVIFDDAMVNTSDARFERMADVLRAMASRLQIVVFTCHWDRYARLGAHRVIDLERVRGGMEGWAAAAE